MQIGNDIAQRHPIVDHETRDELDTLAQLQLHEPF